MGDKKVARSFHVQHYEHRIRLNYHANIGDAKDRYRPKAGMSLVLVLVHTNCGWVHSEYSVSRKMRL